MVTRSAERGSAPLGGWGTTGLLPRARLGGPMPWVIAIMVALTVLASGGGLALANLAGNARGELADSATVQILEADPVLRADRARQALRALQADPTVAEARLVPDAEIAKLLAPWLGGAEGMQAVPLPALIDLQLTHRASRSELDRLTDRLAKVAPGARLDAQSSWLAPVFDVLRSLQWMAMGLIGLLAFTGAAAVWLAARNALGANRETIEIVHLLGGNDRQIARVFQRSILIDAAVGGALGLGMGLVALWALGARFAALESGMFTGGGLDRSDWLVLAAIPIAGVVLASATARFTVLASLRKML